MTERAKTYPFSHLSSFKQKFIPEFSTLTAPLSDLTRKEAPERVKWTPEIEAIFAKVKDLLTSEPVLATPDPKKEYQLQTDASGRGLGATLSQLDENGDDKPIAFYSKKLLPRQQRYSGVETECLAVVEAVKHFSVYLEGVPFKIVTDNRALVYLDKFRNENSRLTRWALALQPYHFEIVHRPGNTNGNADGLSRQYQEEETNTPK